MVHTLGVVDPGKNDAGLAFFVGGHLAEVAFIVPPNGGPYEVARLAAVWFRRAMMNIGDPEGRMSKLVCEGQQIYGRGGPQNPNDLLPLAQTVGGVMARVDAFEREIVLPKTWTGGIPKEIRQRHFLAALKPHESNLLLAIKPAGKRHNVIDAAHLGFYVLGRTRTTPEEGYKQ